MSKKYEGIDYDEDKEVTKELEKFIKTKLAEILGSVYDEQYYEFIKLLTSKDQSQDEEKQKKDISEILEVDQKGKLKILKFSHQFCEK